MKSNYLLAIVITSFIIFSFTKVGGNPDVIVLETTDVGTVKQSVLKSLPFNKNQTGTWVLLQGQELSQTSELFKILEENSELTILTKKDGKYYLPDARGKFLRSSNVNGVGRDPDSDRQVGSHQDDMLGKHRHSFNSHGAGGGYGNIVDGQSKQAININTSYTGGVETRPVNISLYTYIKVSN